jgi:hypothetical protein
MEAVYFILPDQELDKIPSLWNSYVQIALQGNQIIDQGVIEWC